MNKFTLALAAGLTLSLLASPASASSDNSHKTVQWTPNSWSTAMQAIPKGDPQRGQKLHEEQFCASCHGAHGEAVSQNWPRLAGQRAAYTYKQLMDYHSGLRNEDHRAHVMVVLAELLTKQDMADLASFYAAQELPGDKDARKDHPAYPLVSAGDPSRLITPCSACHGIDGAGGINETSSLRAQTKEYFIRTMKHFHGNSRHNDVAKGMSQFAAPLSDEEIAMLADYYAVPGAVGATD